MHKENIFYTIPAFLAESVAKFSDRPFLGFSDEEPLTFAQVDEKIGEVIVLLQKQGVEKGDKVAILSGNMPHWGIAYFAVLKMGAIGVPILPDFSASEVVNVLTHSETKLIFVSDLQYPKIEKFESDYLLSVVKINDFSIIHGLDCEKDTGISSGFIVDEDDLAAIIYTSGTTGNSKGVMLTHKNLAHNTVSASILQPVNTNDRFLSILPMSHTYENTLGLLLPMYCGASVWYLKKLPTPAVLIPAMQKIKPTMMLSVPLIIEKIYKFKILPALKGKALIRMAYSVPVLRKMINRSAGKKLMHTFGNNLKFFGIGGSKLNPEVEAFLLEARCFPYAIGYGLTETSPLVAGVNPSMARLQSTGPSIEGVEIRLRDVDPHTGEGEIQVFGPNVMKGYYKDPEATAKVFTEDGWFKTGDLGFIDKDGYLFMRGRLKNVIIGSNGENIYPEEIEALINNFEFVSESLVVDQKGKLVAFVHVNTEEILKKYENMKEDVNAFVEAKINDILSELKEAVNSRVNSYSALKMVIAQSVPFEKTATQKIKRYKYTM